jgi:hypothetical protein
MVRPVAAVLVVLCSCGPGVEPPHLLYSQDAQSLSNPFPDARAVARTGFWKPFIPAKVSHSLAALLDGYGPVLAQVEGTGNFAPTLLPATERLDRNSLQGAFVRLQQVGSDWQVLEADVPAESSRATLIAEGKTVPDDFPEFVLARPTRPLPEGMNGMLVVKKGLRTEAGVALGRGFDLGSEMTERCRTAAKVLGIAETDVLLALPVTAAPVSARFTGIVTALEALPAAQMSVAAHGMLHRDDGDYFDGKWAPTDADWSQLSKWTEKWSWEKPAQDIGSIFYGSFPSHDLRENGVWKD